MKELLGKRWLQVLLTAVGLAGLGAFALRRHRRTAAEPAVS